MRRTRLFLPWTLLAGLLLAATTVEAVKATALVLNKLKQSQTSTEAPSAPDDLSLETQEESEEDNSTSTRSPLTGIPQKDYVHDPNLPRELNGYNLTDYPFYDRVPDDMDFKCDGLHDGFYASVPHKCQVYHHCLFGTRYDFLCANYTAFDQKTFICHFVSEVDCANSPKYFKRNEALYKAATTSTAAPPRPPPAAANPVRRPQGGGGGRHKRPPVRPAYDYYYDDDYDEDQDYYEDDVAAAPPSSSGGSRRMRKHPRRPADDDDRRHQRPEMTDDGVAEDTTAGDAKSPAPSGSSVYDRPRVPPKIRRPVPLNERDKYDYNTRPTLAPPPPSTSEAAAPPSRQRDREEPDYYEDEEEYTAPVRSRPKNSPSAADYYPTTAGGERDIVRRPPMSGAGRPNRRRTSGGGRRRGNVDTGHRYTYEDDYDYEYEDEPRRPLRPSRKRSRQPSRKEQDYSGRGYGSQRSSGRYDIDDDEPVPAPRPSYISSSGGRSGYRKRPQASADPVDEYSTAPERPSYRRPISRKQPPVRYADEVDDDYYDDEIEEEPVYRRPRPSNSRPSYKQDESPSRSQSSNKRTFTSPAREGSSTPSRSSSVKTSSPDAPEERPLRIQPSSRSKPESESMSPRYRNPVPVEDMHEELLERQTQANYQIPSNNDDDRRLPVKTENRPKEVPESPRVPPSSYGSFRTKLPQSDRDSSSRVGSNKFRPSGPDIEVMTTTTTTNRPKADPPPIPPSAPSKENFRPIASGGEFLPPRIINGRPVKVIIKPIERDTPRIPDNIPERQNLADISEHEYDVTLNDALHPTLHPTRSIPNNFAPQQRVEPLVRTPIQKSKSNFVGRGGSNEPTTVSGRGTTLYLEGAASQTYVTRTMLTAEEAATEAPLSYRQRRPSAQYDEYSPLRYRDEQTQTRYRQQEVPPYQSRPSWSRRETNGGYYAN